MIRRNFILLFLICFFFICNKASAQTEKKFLSGFRDSLDQSIDISDWLLNKRGFLVLPSVITEPAVDYGLAAAIVYFHSSYTAKHGPPSMTGVLGGATLNGTWLAGVFHIGYWKHDRIRYMGAIARAYANLGFYGSGKLGILDVESVNLNLDAWAVVQQIKFRLSNSNFFLGGRYIYFKTDNTFDIPIDISEFQGFEFSSNLSEASLVINYDSRNNVFTPKKGFFIQLTGTYSDTWMGGDDLYGRISSTIIGYMPASDKLILGIRQENRFSIADVPFYARPIVNLRGVPLMKYQNKNTTVMEAEINWNVVKRWYLTGFTGLGNAFADFDSYEDGKSVASAGAGFRYLLIRKFGAQLGMDFAKSTDDFAFYIVFGTSWLR